MGEKEEKLLRRIPIPRRQRPETATSSSIRSCPEARGQQRPLGTGSLGKAVRLRSEESQKIGCFF